MMNVVSTNMLGWAALTKYDFNEIMSYPVPLTRKFAGDFTAITTIETTILRYLTEFVWKRIPPIDHDFTSRNLIILNIILSLLTAFITFMSGNLK